MKKIDGSPKTLKELLLNTKYSIHYYQREYQWQKKQIEEMIEDLTSEFLNFYQEGDDRINVKDYGSYFMGSVVLTGRDNAIIDGQQRLTSLTLLIMFLLNCGKEKGIEDSNLRGMVYSEAFGQKSFNINVPEREECLNAIFNSQQYEIDNKNESIRNIYIAYKNIEEIFPEEIIENCLLNFGDWLQEKICFIQIVADTEQDAHKVFVSMNDRGLSLTPAEMLKGFLLSEIEDDMLREKCNSLWKKKILSLKDIDVKEDETFIKNWLRAQYAETIRETKKGAVNKDFDIIGTEFHKWVRDNKNSIGLKTSEDYVEFINKFEKYTDIYIKIREFERNYNDKFKYVYYNATNKFTLQEQVILASICSTDTNEIIDKKIDLVSKFLDLYIYSRVVIYKSNDYNTIKNAIFIITKRIRNLSLEDLSNELKAIYQENGINIVDNLDEFRVNGYTKKYIRTMLARITGFIEEKSGLTSRFTDYVNREQTHPYDVEHITPDHYEWYNNEYSSKEEFDSYRNNFADLIILKNHINQSLNDKEYDYKVNTYESANGNILGASLGEKVYLNNPEFSKFIKNNNLNFKSYNKFGKDEINDRKILYKQLCDMIWNIENLNIG